MVIGDTWFGRRGSFVSGGAGGTMYSNGREGGNSVLGMDGECTRLSEMVSDAVYSDTRLTPVLLGRY